MSPQTRKQLSNYVITAFSILLILAITYSLSNSSGMEHVLKVDDELNTDRNRSLSSISKDDILLVKDNKLVVGKTCLNYRELNRDSILIDLYLLDLDKEQPYTQKISRKRVGKEIRLGDYTYQIVAARQGYVKLKAVNFFSAP